MKPEALSLPRPTCSPVSTVSTGIPTWLPILLLATVAAPAGAQSSLRWSPRRPQPQESAVQAVHSLPVARPASEAASADRPNDQAESSSAPSVAKSDRSDGGTEVVQVAHHSELAGGGQPVYVEAAPDLAYPPGVGYSDPEAAYALGDPMGGCECGAGCCDNAMGTSYWPGDYWCGFGQNGCVLPVWSAWKDRLWFRGDYLLWWTQGADVPPLVTTSPAGTDRDVAGVLGQDTTILFGDETYGSDTRSGGRFTLGYWFRPCQFGLQATYLFLGDESDGYEASSEGDPILARPFFNIQDGEQDARLIAFEDADERTIVDGSILVDLTTSFEEAEVLFRRVLYQQCAGRLDFLLGYQFARLEDGLLIEESTVSRNQQGIVAGTEIELFDRFDASNEFHGAELGLVFEEHLCRWSLEMLMKLGLGSTHSQVAIHGQTTTTVPTVDPVTSQGGLLARQSNIGSYERDHFAVIPELGVTLGYDVTCNLRATVGYTFIYWSKVARPGDQIDLDVIPPPVTGADEESERPAFSWVTTDFWAQGLNFGLDYRF